MPIAELRPSFTRKGKKCSGAAQSPSSLPIHSFLSPTAPTIFSPSFNARPHLSFFCTCTSTRQPRRTSTDTTVLPDPQDNQPPLQRQEPYGLPGDTDHTQLWSRYSTEF